MIVCSCNVISDRQIRDVVSERSPRMTSQVYGCLGCSAQCGRCARTIRKIMNQALAQCGDGCACCPNNHAGDHHHDHGDHADHHGRHGHHHHEHDHEHDHHPHAHHEHARPADAAPIEAGSMAGAPVTHPEPRLDLRSGQPLG